MPKISLDDFRSSPFLIVLGLLIVVSGASAYALFLHKGAGSAQLTKLTCGDNTYMLNADKISDDVTAACDRVKQSIAALAAYRAAMTRFTCQDSSNGHVILSLPIPNGLFDGYNKNCQEYLAAEDAFHNDMKISGANHNAAMSVHGAAFTKFNNTNNEFAKKRGEDDGTLYRQKQADQSALNNLIKNLGGSIEIKNQ